MAATVIIAVVVRLCFALSVGFSVNSWYCIGGPVRTNAFQCGSDKMVSINFGYYRILEVHKSQSKL